MLSYDQPATGALLDVTVAVRGCSHAARPTSAHQGHQGHPRPTAHWQSPPGKLAGGSESVQLDNNLKFVCHWQWLRVQSPNGNRPLSQQGLHRRGQGGRRCTGVTSGSGWCMGGHGDQEPIRNFGCFEDCEDIRKRSALGRHICPIGSKRQTLRRLPSTQTAAAAAVEWALTAQGGTRHAGKGV